MTLLKRITIVAVALITVVSAVYFASTTDRNEPEVKQISKHGYSKSVEGLKEEVYQNALCSSLHPYVQKEVEQYYGKGVWVDPWDIKLLSLEESQGAGEYKYFMKVEAMPHVHSHLYMGIDQISFRMTVTGTVEVEKFEHIKSLDDLEQYRKAHPNNPENRK